MKKILRRAAVLFLVFILGVAGTMFLLNSETTDDRSDMNDPTLPEVMVDVGGVRANRMYGYVQPMQADFMRDSLTPLDTTKKLTFVINPYEAKVKSLSYEIRTSDGSKVMENRKVKNLKTADSYLTASVEISSNLLLNQEYSMRILLDTNVGDVYYYTRVISRAKLNADGYVKFVNSFSEKCMDKAAVEELAAYLEPEDTGGTNYANISIKSTLSNVSWGKLNPQIAKKGVPIIRDINETTASISLEYQITARDESGNTELYDVAEFYRMRYSEDRIRLLDFERSANQVFDPELPVISPDGLLLGIRNKDVTYMTNEDGSIVVFSQQGDLWSYTPENGKIVKIFSFRRSSGSDFRDSRTEHDIKIIRVEENGDVDFVLYGYMNRGIHEGLCGVCVYHYNSDQNVVEEKVFIPSTESYQFLHADMGTLSYVNGKNELFLLLAEKLYRINIDERKYDVMDENISSEDFCISATNAHAAWLVQEGSEAGKIKMIDFDTCRTRFLAPGGGQELRVLGFMNEDVVYGIILDGDIVKDKNDHLIEGIHTLRIENFDGEVKKEYHKDGLYITDITVGDTLMEFELSKKKDNGYKVKKKDNIMNNKKTSANRISVELTSSERTGTRVRLAFEDAPDTDEPLILYAKLRSVEERIIELDTEVPQGEVYYVYARGKLDSTYAEPAKAVIRADEMTGVVLNRAQQYVWERGNKKTKFRMNLEDVPEIMRTGIWDKEKLKEGLKGQGSVIDLSGCSLDSVLYEVSAQRPVIAKTGSDTSVVIVGYDEYNTYLLDPGSGEISPYGMNDSAELFRKAGNIFISYLETVKY